MPPKSAPQAQYGFVESDENPFDEPVAPPPRQAPRQSQPPAARQSQGGNAQQPRLSQGAPRPPVSQGQPRAAAAPQQPAAAAAAPKTSPSAGSPASAAAAGAGVGAAAAAAAAPAPKKSGFASFLPSFGGNKEEGSTGGESEDMSTREANLRAREEKLARMEMEVEQRERTVKQKEGAQNNWPSKCYPVLYHSIPDQIPTRLQPMIKKFYYMCIWTWIALFWNVVTVITVWGETGDGGSDPIWCIVWLLLGCPGAWWFWYRPVFEGAMNNSSRRYLIFFVGFFMHLAFSLIIGLGTPSMGAGGLMVMIKEYAKSYPVSGTFALVDSCLWAINFFVGLYLIKIARDAWRTGGGSEQLEKDRKKMAIASKAGFAAI